MSSRRTERVKQTLKRIPGIGPARRRVLAAARGNQALRELVRRLYHVDQGVPTPMDITAGTLLDGVGTEALPVALVLVLGADERGFEQVVVEVATQQRVTAGFRPVLVSDHPGFPVARRFGYPLELLVREQDWDPVVHGRAWREYVRDRLALLLTCYRATVTVPLPAHPQGLGASGRLLLSALQASTAEATPDG